MISYTKYRFLIVSERSTIERHAPSQFNDLCECEKEIQSYLVAHFPKVQVALNKNFHNIWHCFQAQYFMPHLMMKSVLFWVLAPEPLSDWCKVFNSRSKASIWMGFTRHINYTMWKGMKNHTSEWCQKFCTFCTFMLLLS